MSGIDPRRKRVAVLAACICTMNMPFMLLMSHARGSRYLPYLVVFYILAMAALLAYTIVECMRFKRSGR
jgi:predicted permease